MGRQQGLTQQPSSLPPRSVAFSAWSSKSRSHCRRSTLRVRNPVTTIKCPTAPHLTAGRRIQPDAGLVPQLLHRSHGANPHSDLAICRVQPQHWHQLAEVQANVEAVDLREMGEGMEMLRSNPASCLPSLTLMCAARCAAKARRLCGLFSHFIVFRIWIPEGRACESTTLASASSSSHLAHDVVVVGRALAHGVVANHGQQQRQALQRRRRHALLIHIQQPKQGLVEH